jgi:hypothetical protein
MPRYCRAMLCRVMRATECVQEGGSRDGARTTAMKLSGSMQSQHSTLRSLSQPGSEVTED